MKTKSTARLLILAFMVGGGVPEWGAGAGAERIYLSGKGPSDAVEWQFYCSEGRRSGQWTTLPVPSNWEQQGFGNYDYGHVPSHEKHGEIGRYRIRFHAPNEWRDKLVRLVFEGAMTDTAVKLNGTPVGSVNQGGYHQFHHVLTDTGRYGQHVIKFGQDNELEVQVAKQSSNPSLEAAERAADYWVFGGIYRPVYLEILPKTFINRVAIDANADGGFRMDVYPQVHLPRDNSGGDHVDALVAQVETLEGDPVGEPMSTSLSGGGAARIRLQTRVENPHCWSPEFPNRYQVRVSLQLEGRVLHERVERFGFRTFELRPRDGFYLNGRKIRLRGVNRNTFRPDTGRAIDPEEAWQDAVAIKGMNANAVRCHLPPTAAFMEACDELGLLFVIERTNWQRPVADTPVARQIVYDLATRFHNHPSLVMWANGNESGFNHEVDELFALLDLQERPVIHPWALFGGIDTHHYPDYDRLRNQLRERQNVVVPTELLHGLYDGGHGAGLSDYWNLIRSAPNGGGGFLWCWADAAIERTDQDGRLDTDGNHSADGIVGPYGEKEGSYAAVRDIWSPVQIQLERLPSGFDGKLPVENRHDEMSLDQCAFRWRLALCSDPFSDGAETRAAAEGVLAGPPVAPGSSGSVDITLPDDWRTCDLLELTAVDPGGRQIRSWSWPIDRAVAFEGNRTMRPEQLQGKPFEVRLGDGVWSFSPITGRLLGCAHGGVDCGLGNGPVIYAGAEGSEPDAAGDWTASVLRAEDSVVIASNDGNGSWFKWTLSPGGTVTLDYEFAEIRQELAYCAVGFDLADEAVASKRWRGEGPFRIWANRVQGPRYGLWENDYNDGVTGVNWIYPEFKGVFGNVDWMRIRLKSGARILVVPAPGSNIGILRPRNAEGSKAASPKSAVWQYPAAGGLFLFHKVPAVGTKFKVASSLGPQSRPQRIEGPIRGTVVFHLQSTE